MFSSDQADLDCRICRCGSEDLRPLYNPCLCTGSIGLVHQDCLEAWLNHSHKDKCELCSTTYTFLPEYAADTPVIVPLPILLKATLKLFKNKLLPVFLKLVLGIACWLIFVPLWTSWAYR